MNVSAACDSERDRAPAWSVELTDLALIRVPARVIRAVDLADVAVIDGVRVRRHDGRRITVDGHGQRPAWLT